MKMYNLDWHLEFYGNINNETIEKLTKKLSMTEFTKSENCEIGCLCVYKIHRSLDICLPVILTEFDGDEFEISTYRDNKKNIFVVKISA